MSQFLLDIFLFKETDWKHKLVRKMIIAIHPQLLKYISLPVYSVPLSFNVLVYFNWGNDNSTLLNTPRTYIKPYHNMTDWIHSYSLTVYIVASSTITTITVVTGIVPPPLSVLLLLKPLCICSYNYICPWKYGCVFLCMHHLSPNARKSTLFLFSNFVTPSSVISLAFLFVSERGVVVQ